MFMAHMLVTASYLLVARMVWELLTKYAQELRELSDRGIKSNIYIPYVSNANLSSRTIQICAVCWPVVLPLGFLIWALKEREEPAESPTAVGDTLYFRDHVRAAALLACDLAEARGWEWWNEPDPLRFEALCQEHCESLGVTADELRELSRAGEESVKILYKICHKLEIPIYASISVDLSSAFSEKDD